MYIRNIRSRDRLSSLIARPALGGCGSASSSPLRAASPHLSCLSHIKNRKALSKMECIKCIRYDTQIYIYYVYYM